MFSIFQVQFSIQFSSLLFSFCLFFLLLPAPGEEKKEKRVKKGAKSEKLSFVFSVFHFCQFLLNVFLSQSVLLRLLSSRKL